MDLVPSYPRPVGALPGARPDVRTPNRFPTVTNARLALCIAVPLLGASPGCIAREPADVAGTGAPDALPVTLSVAAPRTAVDEPLELLVQTRNPADGPASLLLWNTPFEPVLSTDAFEVTRDGEPVAYLGRMVRRLPPPRDEDVVRLAPGEAFARTLDLARHYALDAPGTYEIRFAPRPITLDDGSGDASRFAPLVAADDGPVVVERR